MITIKAPAKINLALDTLHKRKDNYHEVEMIMTTVDLADYITVTPLEKNEIVIKSNEFTMPLNEKNLAYQAAQLFKQHFNIDKGVEIYIKKRIPVAAGLAGGSSNAAATLKALKELWKVDCTIDELAELGAQLRVRCTVLCLWRNSASNRSWGNHSTNSISPKMLGHFNQATNWRINQRNL